MSTKKALDERRKALENVFFERENEKLLTKLRDEKQLAAQRQALFDVTKIQDETVLDHLIEVGIRAETWLAISLLPLVEVAWADRIVQDEQRAAIMKAAEAHGIKAGSDAGDLLQEWLTTRPRPKVREVWMEYVEAVSAVLSGAAREAMREETLEMSKAVAEAAGGFLGLGHRISHVEQQTLDDLERAF
jgi:hypothetical protein